MNNVLNDNLIIFYFVNYCYKYKKLDFPEEIQRKIIRIRNNVNEEIILQNDEHDVSIDLDRVD